MWSSVRIVLAPLGLTAVWWSTIVLPIFGSAIPGRELTERIVTDDRFKPGILSAAAERMEGTPNRTMRRAEMARAEALVNLRLAEEVMGRQPGNQLDQEQERAHDKVRESLALNPADSFLWLMLYSVTATRTGFEVSNIRYLDASYSTGPLEGWIGLRRNRLALSIFPMLADSVQQMVVSEFAELVDADFVEDPATSLMGVGWPQRERLLAALQDVNPASKKRLQGRLLWDGVKLAIPGIEQEERPWQ
jgi:hypothetical protein